MPLNWSKNRAWEATHELYDASNDPTGVIVMKYGVRYYTQDQWNGIKDPEVSIASVRILSNIGWRVGEIRSHQLTAEDIEYDK